MIGPTGPPADTAIAGAVCAKASAHLCRAACVVHPPLGSVRFMSSLRSILEARRHRLGSHPTLVGACLSADRSSRFLVLSGVFAPGVRAGAGLLAGCH
eukprot:2346258-Pyramimonas_sp.AAC.1